MEGQLPRVLCVDDEPAVLEGLTLHLRRRCELRTATSGAAALDLLAREPPVAVIVSDMRMPGMDGAVFLSRTRQVAPDAVRMLLTGQADLQAAVSAVNDGQIFRFLTKPCPPSTLLAALEAGVAQHRLVTSERVLLEQTLHGSITALTDVLALANPVSFGRANRIKQHVTTVAQKLELPDRWQLEVAAMLSQLGCIMLPADVVEKVYFGRPLTADEEKMVARIPAVTEQLLAKIPRIEVIRGILAGYARSTAVALGKFSDEDAERVALGAQLLRVAVDFDALEAQGLDAPTALSTLRGRGSRYDAAVLAALEAGHGGGGDTVRELPFAGLQVGMVLAEDVKLSTGTLLVARGYVITQGFVERLRNFQQGVVVNRVRVIVKETAA